jgi:hypothetical protein
MSFLGVCIALLRGMRPRKTLFEEPAKLGREREFRQLLNEFLPEVRVTE